MNRADKAIEIRSTSAVHCNCCQAVLLAYADRAGLDEDTLWKLGAAFGGGMGSMEGTCGALCAAEMLTGLSKYSGKPVSPHSKTVFGYFRERIGETVCAEIKGVKTGKPAASCELCIRTAAESLEKLGIFPEGE